MNSGCIFCSWDYLYLVGRQAVHVKQWVVGPTYFDSDTTSERLWTPLWYYFPLQQHALVTSSKRKELLFCSKCSSEISPLNNWTLHKSRVFSPRSHSIRARVYYIPNCNTPKQMMKSTNIFMLYSYLYFYLSVFFLWSKVILVCRSTLNVFLGGKKWLVNLWYLVDVLCRQPIKLFQVVSASEFHEYWWNDLEIIFLVPAAFCRASEARTQSRP